MKNLQELPRFADKLSYLYVEHAIIEQSEKAIAVIDADGSTPVPAAALAVLILGPGTSITHAAVKALADNNCQVIWSGEQCVRLYAHGLGGARHSRNLLRQAALVSDEISRLQVVIRMYCLRFNETVDPSVTIQQLRGKEGIRVRQAYRQASEKFGVPWEGRSYKRQEWNFADPVNRALSAANSCLYGLVHAAIISGGFSAAIGFVHTGKQLSFVYDVADLYKTEFVIPLAFEAARDSVDIERRIRYACRDSFASGRLMQRILPDINKVLNIPQQLVEQEDEFADDEARPAGLWEPRNITVDTPIGQVLKLKAVTEDLGLQGDAHGRADPGTGDAVTAG
jgi:CRISPR-associated protein Cas1